MYVFAPMFYFSELVWLLIAYYVLHNLFNYVEKKTIEFGLEAKLEILNVKQTKENILKIKSSK